MSLLGAHLSIAGGLYKAVEEAVRLGCDTVQLFTASPNSWNVRPVSPPPPATRTTVNPWIGKPLSDDDVKRFRTALKAAKLKYPTAHDSYLINLAAPGDELYAKSVAALADELTRAEQLGLAYLVTHPGAHVGSGENAGLVRVAGGLDEVHRRCPGYKVKILLETTAGMGTTLGHRFEHLAELLDRVSEPGRLGVCLDTCHVFAAGYDLRTDSAYDATFAEFDRVVGLKRLKAVHVNDSVKDLGSRVDRHAGIGLGKIGEHAFRRLVTDPRLVKLPLILETPKESADGDPMDPVNLGKLRGFAR